MLVGRCFCPTLLYKVELSMTMELWALHLRTVNAYCSYAAYVLLVARFVCLLEKSDIVYGLVPWW